MKYIPTLCVVVINIKNLRKRYKPSSKACAEPESTQIESVSSSSIERKVSNKDLRSHVAHDPMVKVGATLNYQIGLKIAILRFPKPRLCTDPTQEMQLSSISVDCNIPSILAKSRVEFR
ncbi:uncharacterized protein LOC142225936 [Haematobia irritans]|uniref:uncharacterized protein LOC142225936 n=1 Tax=Haematobia irritans TaxID=7368 RepID=UPI003F5084B6